VDLLTQGSDHDLVVKRIETPGDVALNEPLRPVPDIDDLTKCGVATSSGTEAVGMVGELDVVVRVQQQANYLGEQFVRPAR
jgi:hypothetical protein